MQRSMLGLTLLAVFLFHLKVSAVSLSFLLFLFYPFALALFMCQEATVSPEVPAQSLNKIKMDRAL